MDGGGLKPEQTIVITGASGFTGQHACAYFSSIGMNVVAFVRQKITIKQSVSIRQYVCDLLDRAALEESLRSINPDYVLHLGGKNSVPEAWQKPLLYMESNIMATLNLLDALRHIPSCRILVAGSRLNFTLQPPYRPEHPYSLSKSLQSAGALSWASLFGQSVMIAEPCNLIGPGPSTGFCSLLGKHIAGLERGEEITPFILSSRTARRDFLDVRDAVRAYAVLLSMGQSGTTYQIDSGIERTLYEVALSMVKIASCSVPISWIEQEDSQEMPSSQTFENPVIPEYLSVHNWRPEIPIQQSFVDIVDYFRLEGGAS